MQIFYSPNVLRSIVSAPSFLKFRTQTRIHRFKIFKTLANPPHNSAYGSWDFDQASRSQFTSV